MSNQIAFLFPGQGSQKVGMLGELASESPIVQQTYKRASEVLGYDLWKLVKEGPEEQLNQTEKTQPALLVGEVAIWRIWREEGRGQAPIFMAGHSLGEYSALTCAGAMGFEDAVQLVANRGRYMQEAVTDGAGGMVAIVGLEDELIDSICKEAAEGKVLTPANFNSPGQTVIAGDLEAAKRAVTLAEKAGARLAKILPVSVPCHSELMKPAAERLARSLDAITLKSPTIPVIHNYDVKIHSEPEEIRTVLIKQLYSPVRWVETIKWLANQQITKFIECGPGGVLSSLSKRISREIPASSISLPAKLQTELAN